MLRRPAGRAVLASVLVTAVAAVAATASAAPVTGPAAAVPRGFVGMVLTDPVFPTTASDPTIDLANQLDRMVAAGVENLRVVFNWAAAQPYPGWSQVPPADQGQFTDVGGIPTAFGPIDTLVRLAAERGLTVLPDVLYAPGWDTGRHPAGTYGAPARDRPYGAFVRALVQRYGPHGSFWQTHSPRLPIGAWQIWNEPNLSVFWPKQPFARSYLALLSAAHQAIKDADPRAKVVLAGLPNYSWRALASLYRQKHARRLFDVVAIHPYTRTPQDVIAILHKAREVMDRAGDRRKPIIADEISWPSSGLQTSHSPGFDFGTTEAGQAHNLATLLPLLGRDRRRLNLAGFDYYTWAGIEDRGGISFDFSGLLRVSSGRLIAKPALYAFRRAALALESCARKGRVATHCARLLRR